ncbi:MAG TPA: type II toxin-antitoxin system HicA family toxin [Bacteroidales bacterium]
MKPRKTKDIQKVLEKKGFILEPEKDHHQFYYLQIDGKKQAIKTYFSHSKKEYDKFLMNQIKKQLRFKETEKAEDFFDCPMTREQYVEMLIEDGEIKKK